MDILAKALVLAINYIEQRTSSHTEDDDVQALEDIASMLAACTRDERQAFSVAAAALNHPELPEELGLNSQ